MDPTKSVSSDIQYQGHESLQKLEGKDTSGRTFVVKTHVDEITGQEIKTIKALNKWQKIWASLTSCFGSKYEALTASDFKNLREGVLKTGLNDNTRILGTIVLKQQLNDLREGKLQGNSAEEIVKNYSKAVIQTILDNVPKGSHADQLVNMSLFKEMKNEEKIITLIKLGVNFDTGLGDEVLGKRIAMGMWSQQDLNDLLPTDQKKMPSDKAQVSSPKSTGGNDPASSLKKNSQPEKHPQKDLDSSIPIAEVEAVPKEPEVQAEPMPQHDSSTYHRKVPEVKKYAKGDLDPSIPKRDKQKKLGKGNVSDAVYEQKGNPDLAIKIVNRWGEYVIGAALDHPVLAKTHQLYAREHPDLPSLNKYKMVMEKVKGQEITKCNIPNDQVVTLMEDAKDCCLYLFRAEVCWEDINFGNVFVEDTGHLKLIDFGSHQ